MTAAKNQVFIGLYLENCCLVGWEGGGGEDENLLTFGGEDKNPVGGVCYGEFFQGRMNTFSVGGGTPPILQVGKTL